jgi:dienelactone hydrolase
VLEASVNPRIQALVLISGTLSQAAKEYLKSENSVPLLGVVGKDDKKSFRELAQAYALSSNRSSDFLPAVGHGAVMFSHTEGLEAKVVHWMEHNLKALGTEKEISFRSEDGLTLHGTLRLPDGATAGAKVPGVVLVHGAKHDQQTYHFMAREIAKHGMATLRFDWRGKARSENGGSTTNVDRVDLDVKAAIQLLASQPVVDSNRIGLVAATAGTGHALRAANGDTRIQTMVLLTVASVPEGDAKQFLTTSGKPILAIASMEDINYNRGSLADSTREAYLLSNSEGSEFLLYDDAGRGSEILKVKPELEPMILRWLDDKLQGIPPTRVHGQE